MLIISCPCTLLGLRFSRIVSILCSVKLIFDKDLLVLRKIVGGILLLLLIKENFLAKKKELNNSALRLKPVMKPFSRKSGRMHGIFLSFKNNLRIDQYILGLVESCINFLNMRECNIYMHHSFVELR